MSEDKLDEFEQTIEDEAELYQPVSREVEKMISDKIDAINAQRTTKKRQPFTVDINPVISFPVELCR